MQNMNTLWPALALTIFLASCGGSAPQTPEAPTFEVSETSLQKPILTVNSELASWTESNAHEYRLVYHKEGFPPVANGYGTQNGTEIFTKALSVSLELSSGTWIIFVEAYDELGNSYFSDVRKIE